jgi:hypothetical protein
MVTFDQDCARQRLRLQQVFPFERTSPETATSLDSGEEKAGTAAAAAAAAAGHCRGCWYRVLPGAFLGDLIHGPIVTTWHSGVKLCRYVKSHGVLGNSVESALQALWKGRVFSKRSGALRTSRETRC